MTDYHQRKEILKELQTKRKSTILTYFNLTDRPYALNTNIAEDSILPVHSLLKQIGEKDRIELFLYTRGGTLLTAYTIVKMIREYTKNFNVIIPFRAHSAGTLIALGANQIVMTKLGQLGPIDPSTPNIFNPLINPAGNLADLGNRKSISVEDVQAFLNFSKDTVGLQETNQQLEVFKELTKSIEPLALGNVNRVYAEHRLMAKELLSYHINGDNKAEKIDNIIKIFSETYTHNFVITRDNAEKFELNIERPDNVEEALIMKLFESYKDEMKMTIPFDSEAIFNSRRIPAQPPKTVTPLLGGQSPQQPQQIPIAIFKTKLGAIESLDNSYMFIQNGFVNPQNTPPITYKIGTWYPHNKLEAPANYD